MKKRVLNPQRLRKVPPQFSWIDHRLVQENYFTRCDHSSWALYLFLVSVADVDGLSYYSDASLMRRLKMDELQLSLSRRGLATRIPVKPPENLQEMPPAERPGITDALTIGDS